MKSSHFIMAKNTKEIVVLDSDESGSSDVEEEVLSSKQPHRAEDDVVDLTRVSTTTITANHHNSRRRRCNTDGEVEFVGSTSARRSSAAASAASASPDIEFVGTKRPRSTNQNSHRSSIPNRMNNFNNNNYSTMNNPMSNNGAFMDRISSMLGFGGGAGLDVLNRGNFGGMTGMGSNQSASRSRFGSIHGINDHPMPTNVTSKKRKKTKTSSKPVEEKPTAMMKGKAMQQPQGFDAIDMYYPRLKANDRTSILHNLLSKCTNSRKTRKFVHDFRVKFEKVNPKSTLWRLAKELSEEITRLEGESKMSSVKKLKSEEDGNDHKENKHNVGCIDDSGSDKKPTASIGSLSGDVLDTLAIYFRAYQVGQKDHKAMLDAIEPTESPGSLTCCICSDDFDAGDTVACSGDVIHFFCKPCLSSYCTLTLESGPIQSITCAMPDCKALYATNDIKSILSEYDILKIEHREDSRDRRVAMSAKAMLHCECGVVAIVTEEDMGDGRIACPGSGCKRRFCAKCGNEDHGKESCPPPAETVQWLDKHSKQCPNCSNRIEKNGGCDHMTCCPPGGCGYEFWWTCGCPFKGQHKCGR